MASDAARCRCKVRIRRRALPDAATGIYPWLAICEICGATTASRPSILNDLLRVLGGHRDMWAEVMDWANRHARKHGENPDLLEARSKPSASSRCRGHDYSLDGTCSVCGGTK